MSPDVSTAVVTPSPPLAGESLRQRLPLVAPAPIDGRPVSLVTTAGGGIGLLVGRDLADDERGRFHRGRLRRAYAVNRRSPLRDAVVYMSFGGLELSDGPLAVFNELRRRGAAYEHLWVVRDGMWQVPEGATAVRADGTDFHSALASSRYLVVNDHLPTYVERRTDQVVVQTWHGTPLRRLGSDLTDTRGTPGARRFVAGPADRWSYLVTPSALAAEVLTRVFDVAPEVIDVGYPRADVLAAPGLPERVRALRAALGVPADKKVLLYAPTYREHLANGAGEYALQPALDPDLARRALEPDWVLLVRRHRLMTREPLGLPAGYGFDVSDHPDALTVAAAADALVTDYSSLMFDFAVTGRPIVHLVDDLDTYEDNSGDLYVDLRRQGPGPVVADTQGLVDRLAALPDLQAEFADRYATFAAAFAPRPDAGAAARVVDRVFGA